MRPRIASISTFRSLCPWSAPSSTIAVGSPRKRQREPREQPAKILAFLEHDITTVNLGDVADDGEAEAGAGLAGVEPGAAVEDRAALSRGDALAVILDLDLDRLR